ncbi:MAG: hypothetical protein RIQ89_1191 [Bacteroidota bacterium]|jgi:L-lactate utilization protein LutB
MSLTSQQQQELKQLSQYLRDLEKNVVENGIDLDVYMAEYHEGGYADYRTETITFNDKAAKRKKVFEKANKKVNVKN